MKKLTARDMVQIALVAAIYIALTITPPFNAISFGAYQFRISEMMNFNYEIGKRRVGKECRSRWSPYH